jgi:hypothetical protein
LRRLLEAEIDPQEVHLALEKLLGRKMKKNPKAG